MHICIVTAPASERWPSKKAERVRQPHTRHTPSGAGVSVGRRVQVMGTRHARRQETCEHHCTSASRQRCAFLAELIGMRSRWPIGQGPTASTFLRSVVCEAKSRRVWSPLEHEGHQIDEDQINHEQPWKNSHHHRRFFPKLMKEPSTNVDPRHLATVPKVKKLPSQPAPTCT